MGGRVRILKARGELGKFAVVMPPRSPLATRSIRNKYRNSKEISTNGEISPIRLSTTFHIISMLTVRELEITWVYLNRFVKIYLKVNGRFLFAHYVSTNIVR